MPDITDPIRILVLEDEPVVRRVAARILIRRRYEVLDAGSAAEARELLDAFEGPVHLLICDLHLEGLQGREAAIMLRARRPEMRVPFTSGSSEAEFREELEATEEVFLAKPFGAKELFEAVEGALKPNH